MLSLVGVTALFLVTIIAGRHVREPRRSALFLVAAIALAQAGIVLVNMLTMGSPLP